MTYSIAGQAIALRMTGHPDGNNGIYYLYSDHLGSNSVMSTMSGTKVSETRYLPFGGYRTATTNYGDKLTDQGFTGHKENRDIGLIYMNARYYVHISGLIASKALETETGSNTEGFGCGIPGVDLLSYCQWDPSGDTISTYASGVSGNRREDWAESFAAAMFGGDWTNLVNNNGHGIKADALTVAADRIEFVRMVIPDYGALP